MKSPRQNGTVNAGTIHQIFSDNRIGVNWLCVSAICMHEAISNSSPHSKYFYISHLWLLAAGWCWWEPQWRDHGLMAPGPGYNVSSVLAISLWHFYQVVLNNMFMSIFLSTRDIGRECVFVYLFIFENDDESPNVMCYITLYLNTHICLHIRHIFRHHFYLFI